jgi:transaldolase
MSASAAADPDEDLRWMEAALWAHHLVSAWDAMRAVHFHNLPLQQEIIFASTGKKLDWQSEDYYVEAMAGSDIQTNPPATNDWVDSHDKAYTRQVDKLPPKEVLDEIDRKVDVARMEKVLMEEGTKKFADPQKALEQQIGQKRTALAGAK